VVEEEPKTLTDVEKFGREGEEKLKSAAALAGIVTISIIDELSVCVSSIRLHTLY
jgi:hypothetical protein